MSEKEKEMYERSPELKGFLLEDVQKPGKRLRRSGVFGNVEVLTVGGTTCVGKRLHMALLDTDDRGSPAPLLYERFASGCQVLSCVQHPNVTQFMGLCSFNEVPYPILVMEAIYDDFHTLLESYSNLPFPLILHVLHDVTKGLVYLHTQQSPPIVHRDLSARNVLIDKASMKSKITDHWNSLFVDPTKLSLASQTPCILPYMPPEALDSNSQYDTKFDIFSLGHMMLFALLQEFPKDLLPLTYLDPDTAEPKSRTEVERRDKYVRKLFVKLTRSHVMTKMILRCLHNIPEKR